MAILARGGGGITDLALFDRAEVCKAIARGKVPVLVSIGHFTDDLAAPLLAAISFKVPAEARAILTAAAEHRPVAKTRPELVQHVVD